MMMNRSLYFLASYVLFFSFFTISVCGQQVNDSLEVLLKPYGSLRGNMAFFDDKMELQENASRIGVELKIKKGELSFIAGGEVQLNMFRGSTSFNVDGNLSRGFVTVESTQDRQVFGNRLGYLGIDFGRFGVVTIGKQWSVYRDVTAYTDRFNVFGARASATFIGGTDGGETGTGVRISLEFTEIEWEIFTLEVKFRRGEVIMIISSMDLGLLFSTNYYRGCFQ